MTLLYKEFRSNFLDSSQKSLDEYSRSGGDSHSQAKTKSRVSRNVSRIPYIQCQCSSSPVSWKRAASKTTWACRGVRLNSRTICHCLRFVREKFVIQNNLTADAFFTAWDTQSAEIFFIFKFIVLFLNKNTRSGFSTIGENALITTN